MKFKKIESGSGAPFTPKGQRDSLQPSEKHHFNENHLKSHSHSHSHSHGHSHGHHHHHFNCGAGALQGGDSSKVGLAFFLNFGFALIEILGGFLTGSYAILADALHDAGDSLTFGIAWLLERYSRKSKDHKFTYGYARYSLLGSMIVSMVIMISSIFIVFGAFKRFADPVAPTTESMMGFALLGVLVNGYAYFKMSRSSHYLDKNLKWHMFEDAAGWVAVLVGAVIIHFTNWVWIDPLLAICIAVFVSINVIRGFGRTLDILLQAKPEDTTVEDIRAVIYSVEGVSALHDLHVWSLNGMTQILTAHVVAEDPSQAQHLKNEIRHRLSNLGLFHCTLEVESKDDFCKDQC